jgi:putative flippase GtrA
MELVRFGLVGILSTAITYGVYYLLMHYINASIAYTVAYLIAFFVNFILTTYFTFCVKPTVIRGLSFVISNVINYLVSVGLLNLFIWLGLSKSLAPIPMFAITILTNFVMVRWLLKK